MMTTDETAIVNGMVHDFLDPFDPKDDPQEGGDDPVDYDTDKDQDGRTFAFSILLQPCGSCGDAIPAIGPRVCDTCYHVGYCPICACAHGARLCPEVAAIIAEQEAQERAIHSAIVRDAAKWSTDDWRLDAAGRVWSQGLKEQFAAR